MIPKEKAKELVSKYSFLKNCFIPSIYEQKQCASIAVDEIINNDNAFIQTNLQNSYWQEVKKEIEKL